MKKKMSLKQLKIESFVTSLNVKNGVTIKGGFDPLNTRLSDCGGCDIVTDDCDGATTAGPGGGNTGWPPSQGCSNNSCVICHTE